VSQEAKAGPSPANIRIGANIRSRRKDLRISQETLGQALNVSFQQVQKYENGTNRVSGESLNIIAKLLHCTILDLVRGCHDAEAEAEGAEAQAAEAPIILRTWIDSARAVEHRRPRLLDKLAALPTEALSKLEGIADVILNATQPEAA